MIRCKPQLSGSALKVAIAARIRVESNWISEFNTFLLVISTDSVELFTILVQLDEFNKNKFTNNLDTLAGIEPRLLA